jgi:hypothetical protein
MGSLGGKARASRLTPEERSEIARKGGPAREANGLPQASHGGPTRPLRIGDVEIRCYVREGGTCFITDQGMRRRLGMAAWGSASRLADVGGPFARKGLPIKDLAVRGREAIKFIVPGHGHGPGVEATALAGPCALIPAAVAPSPPRAL